MKHIIITRINFDDDTLFQKYFEVMKNTYIPSIKSQTNKNFKIGFIINERHIPIINNFFTNEVIFFKNQEEAKKYCIENNVEIQTRHDCDDWMREDYVQKIQTLYNEKINDEECFIIHSKVQKLKYDTGEVFLHGNDYGKNGFISMFLSLCQKKVNNFVYDKNHRHMGEITKKIHLLDDGYTRLVIHGNNVFSHISKTDKFLFNLKKYDLSVLIPTFDNVEYINECIDSIKLASKNFNVEVIFGIDNCLKTKNFILSNKNKYNSNINFIFFEKNLGPYIIRNTLSQISNSDNLLFIDSDDLVHENLFLEVLDGLKTNDVVRFNFYNFKKTEDLKHFDSKNISTFNSVGQLGIKKEKLFYLNGFEPWICHADTEFRIREEKNNFKVKNINKILYYRRRHDRNLTIKKETGSNSILRNSYQKIINEKNKNKNFGKLPTFNTSNFIKISKKENNFKIVLVSTFWNAEKFVKDSINSIKNQTHSNFISYFIDDMSTDNSYEIAKETIGDDNRFILIKNTEKKFKTKNFVDVIKHNPLINFNDVIVEIDGDDQLADSSVLEKINRVFLDGNIWLCGTRWKDKRGNLGNYSKPNPEKARSTPWNFSHMRSFRAFLFRQIKDEHLKMDGEYFKGACDIGHAIPMLEMSGSEHFHYINEPFYIYTWHNNQSYSENGGIGDKTTQSKTGGYIYRLPKYEKIKLSETFFNQPSYEELWLEKIKNERSELSQKLGFGKVKNKKPIDYEKINQVVTKNVYIPAQHIKPTVVNKPNKRQELVELKKNSLIKEIKKNFKTKPNRRNNLPNIF